MAGDKTLKLSIWIAGKMDKSLTASINAANAQMSSLSKNMSHVGTVGLAAMGALSVGTVAALTDCTKEAVKYQNVLGDVLKYVDGVADEQGRIGKNAIGTADNGKTYAENYDTVYNAILNVATVVPMAKEEIAELTAIIGQSDKTIEQMFTFDGKNVTGGLVKDAAVMAAAWDISAKEAADYGAKWENSFRMSHEQVMELANQINYLGANSATTAAEIASAVNQAASLGQLAGIDPATVAALADAMLATGVSADSVGTSIKRMTLNLSRGENMTKKQRGVLAEMGLTAQWVAKSLRNDSVGTINTLFNGIKNLPKERQLDAVGQLFGIWASEGGAKIVNNLDVYARALEMVGDQTAYMNSMQREFNIKSATPEAVRQMRDSAIEMFKVNIGENFLPVRAQMDEAVRQLFLQLNDTLPELTTLAASAANYLSDGITMASDALQKAMPHIKDALDYLANNGDRVIQVIKGIGLAFLGLKFAPQIEGAVRGISTLLIGGGGVGSLMAGGTGQEKGRKLGGLFGAVQNLYTGGQTLTSRTGSTVRSVAQAAATGAGMANSAITRTSGQTVTTSGIGGLMQRMHNGTLGAIIGVRNRGVLDQGASGPRGWRNILGVADQITTAKTNGGLLGMARRAAANSSLGQYLGGVGAAATNVGRTKIGGGIANAVKGTGSVLGQILTNIAGPQGIDLPGMWGGAKTLGGAAGNWIGGKALQAAYSRPGQAVIGLGRQVISSAPVQMIGGAIRSVPAMVGNTVSFAGAGAGLLGSALGPIWSGFGGLLTGAAPVVAAISGIIAVVSILTDNLDNLRVVAYHFFGLEGLQMFMKFQKGLENIGSFITNLFGENGVANALAPLKERFAGALEKGGLLSTIFGGEDRGLAAFDGAVMILQSVMGVVGQIVTFSETTVKPIIQDAFAFITQTVLPAIVQGFVTAAPTIASVISSLGNAVMTGMQIIGAGVEFAMPFITGLIQTIMTITSVAIPSMLAGLDVFSQGAASLMENIQSFFNGLISFITGVFTGDWQRAWEGVQQVFGSAFDALADLCKTPINAVIAIINKAISGINSLGLTIPEWVPVLGGKAFSINIPPIDLLANGGFTNGPSIAGEAGREAVISFRPGVRGSNIDTWMQAGRMLGVNTAQAAQATGTPVSLWTPPADNRVKLEEIGTDGRGWPESDGGDQPGGQIIFAPKIIVQGNADRAVLEDVVADMWSQFEAWYDQMQRRRARVAY